MNKHIKKIWLNKLRNYPTTQDPYFTLSKMFFDLDHSFSTTGSEGFKKALNKWAGWDKAEKKNFKRVKYSYQNDRGYIENNRALIKYIEDAL